MLVQTCIVLLSCLQRLILILCKDGEAEEEDEGDEAQVLLTSSATAVHYLEDWAEYPLSLGVNSVN